MEKKSILEKIKSNYIFKSILFYIQDQNFYLKLFKYSKSLQKKINIELFDYQLDYCNKRIKWELYLEFHSHFFAESYKKYLKQKLIDCNIDEITLQKVAVNYFINNPKRIIETKFPHYFNPYPSINKDKRYIDIYSPFFDCLSKNEKFNDIFLLNISLHTKESDKIKNDYISKLNKLSNKFTSLSLEIGHSSANDIPNYLKDFKINFKIIKKLEIIKGPAEFISSINFFKKFLPFIEIANNLVHLSLSFSGSIINDNSLEFINNYKSLEYLFIDDLKINNFQLKINTLKILNLFCCDGITLTNNSICNLNTLNLYKYSTDISYKTKLNFPNLQVISLLRTNSNYFDSIEYKSMNRLIKFEGEDVNIFLKLESPLLEEINIVINSFKELEKIIEKINSFKYLKKIYLTLCKIDNIEDNKDISNIQFENTSVKEMNILFEENVGYLWQFYQLQNNFINLSKLFIEIIEYFTDCDSIWLQPRLELIENQNSKVTNINIKIPKYYYFDYKIYFQSYEDLESIIFDIDKKNINLKKFFPIFDYRIIPIKFKSLKLFHLSLNSDYDYDLIIDIINNIYYNLDNMTNLVDFKLWCDIKEVNDEFYIRFIRKVLSMKYIKNIDISFIRYSNYEYYSKKELQELFPDINYDKYYYIIIQKLENGLFNKCIIY